MSRPRLPIAAAITAVFVLVLSTGGLVMAHNLNEPAQAAGGTGFQMISSVEFIPWKYDNHFEYYNHLLWNPGSSTLFVSGAVDVPDGATITKMTMYVLDNSDNNVTARLYKCPLLGDPTACVLMLYGTSSQKHGYVAVEFTEITEPVVDNQSYTYHAEIAVPASSTYDIGLTAVRIDYAYASFIPAVQR